jgi:hypothetical protein
MFFVAFRTAFTESVSSGMEGLVLSIRMTLGGAAVTLPAESLTFTTQDKFRVELLNNLLAPDCQVTPLSKL